MKRILLYGGLILMLSTCKFTILYRWSLFITMETGKDVQVRCETPGIIGNKPIEGSPLIPDQTIPNFIQSALLGELLIPGREKEDDDSLKATSSTEK